ncbi:MAG: endolytic transglycosylase MltG [Firmicutes bacterium]|nr:endolytic transglycosylase MltG [Bacillota bacterium]
MARDGKRRSNKQKQKTLVLVLSIALVLAMGVFAYTVGLGAVDPKNDEEVTVTIPNGSGASSIVYILDDAGLVKNTFCAKVNARIGGYKSLQANTYIFNRTMSFREMMKAINTGDFNYISKTSINIIAGDRLEQIATKMSAELPYTQEEILKVWRDKAYLKELIDKYWFLTDEILAGDIIYPLEGYFYADTYFITNEDESIKEATEMFLDRMDSELTSRKDAIKKSGFTVHEFLTLTSIVTKEGGSLDEDLPIVAGVFINRLNKGMSLGSDVTVNYIYQQDKVNLTKSQLSNDSPYNTRIHAGLPPSPISAVLGSRMDAVLKYKKTDYLFFYGCPDGSVIFSKTLEEHNKAAAENPWPEDK